MERCTEQTHLRFGLIIHKIMKPLLGNIDHAVVLWVKCTGIFIASGKMFLFYITWNLKLKILYWNLYNGPFITNICIIKQKLTIFIKMLSIKDVLQVSKYKFWFPGYVCALRLSPVNNYHNYHIMKQQKLVIMKP